MSIVGLFGFGVVVGLLSGALGIGGGVLIVPGLMLLFGFSQLEAQGTSLAVLSVPVVIFAALIYYQAGFVRLPTVVSISAGLLVGASCGAWFAPHIPQNVLRPMFGMLLLYVGVLFVFDIRSGTWTAMLPAAVSTAALALISRFVREKLTRNTRPRPTMTNCEYHI